MLFSWYRMNTISEPSMPVELRRPMASQPDRLPNANVSVMLVAAGAGGTQYTAISGVSAKVAFRT
jgi:hypothetical protein